MSTTGPVFLRPAIEIREQADPATVQAKGGVVGGKEGKRKQGKEGGIPGSLSGRECSSDSVLQQSQPFGTDRGGTCDMLCLPATVHYHWHKGTKHPYVREYLFFHVTHVQCSLDGKNVYVFSI